MAFHPMKPETIARRAAEFKIEQKERTDSLYRRLIEKARENPYVWAGTLDEFRETHPEYTR